MSVTEDLKMERHIDMELAIKQAKQARDYINHIVQNLELGDPGISCIDAIEMLTRCSVSIGKIRATNIALTYCGKAGV